MDENFKPGAYRTTDPETSKEAALSIDVNPIEGIVLHHLCVAEEDGRCHFELIRDTGIRQNTISPRTADLVRRKLVVDSGKRRINPDTGKRCIVWTLAKYKPQVSKQRAPRRVHVLIQLWTNGEISSIRVFKNSKTAQGEYDKSSADHDVSLYPLELE